VKVRQSASLVAGVCTLCVAASGSVTPIPVAAAAAPASAKSAIETRAYELTAASDTLVDGLNVAGIPLNNFITVLTALSLAAGAQSTPGTNPATGSLQALPNAIYVAISKGQSSTIPGLINTALANEQTALNALPAVPGAIIATDITLINKFLGDLGFGGIGAAVANESLKTNAVSLDAAPADTNTTLTNLLNVAGLPLNNFIVALTAIAGAAGGFGSGTGGAGSLQGLPNAIYVAISKGQSSTIPGLITTALTSENTALNKLAGTPQAIINTDVAALSALFGGLGTNSIEADSSSISPSARSLAVTPDAADPSTTLTDALNVAGLPLNNFIVGLTAVAGAAGGFGSGTGGAGSLQGLPNAIYVAISKGQSSTIPGLITTALTSENTALNTLAKTPASIVNTDVAAIKKLAGDFGGATTLAAPKIQSNTLALNKSSVTPTVTAPKANNLTVKLDGPSTDSTSTVPTTKVKKTNDNNPVASAVKAINKAAKGSYVGKHRAGKDGSTK
jgi:hypothetical protein